MVHTLKSTVYLQCEMKKYCLFFSVKLPRNYAVLKITYRIICVSFSAKYLKLSDS